MFISKQLKQQNIAEYLIYMWQVEDLIRAYGCNVEQIRQSLVARYPTLMLTFCILYIRLFS